MARVAWGRPWLRAWAWTGIALRDAVKYPHVFEGADAPSGEVCCRTGHLAERRERGMLDTRLHPHRAHFLAQSPGQRLFLALKLSPEAQAAAARPPLALAFVMDTSGSMREKATDPATEQSTKRVQIGGQTFQRGPTPRTKMELVVEALRSLVQSPQLQDADRVSLVKFDDTAEELVPFTQAADRARLLAAADRLSQYSGGTQMGAGLKRALQLLGPENGSRRLVLLTDGQTFDEEVVRQVAIDLAESRVPVTAIGVGQDWNEDLLTHLTDITQGRPLHVVPDNQNPQPPSLRASELPSALLGDLQQAANEVVTRIGLVVRAVKDVKLERITRVYPTLSEVDLSIQPHPLGNAAAGDETVFVLEFSLPARPPARMRLAQLGLTYQVPGANYVGELPPLDLVVEFTADEALAAQVDADVMKWVQQRNIDALVRQATLEAGSNPEQASKTLQLARNMTQKLGNQAMTVVLDRALGELGSSKTISAGTAKTLKIGAKTQTLHMGQNLPSDSDIQRLTGA